MKPRLFIIFIVMLIIPLVAMWVLGHQLAGHERAASIELGNQILDAQLENIVQSIVRRTNSIQDELIKATCMSNIDKDMLVELQQQNPRIKKVFAMNSANQIIWPIGNQARELIDQYSEVLTGQQFKLEQTKTKQQNKANVEWGWYPWFDGPGLQLLFWQQNQNGDTIGIILNRSRMLSELISVLPDDAVYNSNYESASSVLPIEYELVNGLDKPIYIWGQRVPDKTDTILATKQLRWPLGSWKLNCYCKQQNFIGNSKLWLFNIIAAIVIISISFIVLAAFVFREIRQTMNQATQRVNFVSQVSHELKTPLTNIRMYAELMGQEIESENGKLPNYNKIIIDESQRLTRLIANILSFSRKQNKKLILRTASFVADDIITGVVDNFMPALLQNEIAVSLDLDAKKEMIIDRDKFEQIIGNLISNVVKYAVNGKSLKITSRFDDRLIVTVADKGPGVPLRFQRKIFQPFFRISDKTSDGTAGTGIGLSIARDLAQLHGGQLKVSSSSAGSKFTLTI